MQNPHNTQLIDGEYQLPTRWKRPTVNTWQPRQQPFQLPMPPELPEPPLYQPFEYVNYPYTNAPGDPRWRGTNAFYPSNDIRNSIPVSEALRWRESSADRFNWLGAQIANFFGQFEPVDLDPYYSAMSDAILQAQQDNSEPPQNKPYRAPESTDTYHHQSFGQNYDTYWLTPDVIDTTEPRQYYQPNRSIYDFTNTIYGQNGIKTPASTAPAGTAPAQPRAVIDSGPPYYTFLPMMFTEPAPPPPMAPGGYPGTGETLVDPGDTGGSTDTGGGGGGGGGGSWGGYSYPSYDDGGYRAAFYGSNWGGGYGSSNYSSNPSYPQQGYQQDPNMYYQQLVKWVI